MKTYQCNYISMNCETYVIKGANVREVKAPLKSVTLKELFYDLFVPGVMLSVQTGMILRGPLQERWNSGPKSVALMVQTPELLCYCCNVLCTNYYFIRSRFTWHYNTYPFSVRPSLASVLPEFSVLMSYALHLLSPPMQVDKGSPVRENYRLNLNYGPPQIKLPGRSSTIHDIEIMDTFHPDAPIGNHWNQWCVQTPSQKEAVGAGGRGELSK